VLATEQQFPVMIQRLDEIDLRREMSDEALHRSLEKIRNDLEPLVLLQRKESQSRSHSLRPGEIRIKKELQEDCLQSAEKFVSSRSSVAPSSSASVGRHTSNSFSFSGSRHPSLGSRHQSSGASRQASSVSVRNPFSDVGSQISEEDLGEDEFGRIHDWIPTVLEEFEEETENLEHGTIPFGGRFDGDSDGSIEFDIIQQLRTNAVDEMRTANYGKAEEILKRVLQSSDERYERNYKWRPETVEQLAVSYAKQQKWDDAEPLFLELLDPPATREKETFNITHALAEVYLGKEDFRRAKLFCTQAIEGRAKLFGKTHASYFHSVTLLGQIFRAEGDEIKARGCNDMLPLNQLSLQRGEIERLSHMKAEDAAAQIGFGTLKNLLPERCRGKSKKWEDIKNNIIRSRRVSGTGVGYSLLHAVAKYGDEAALMVLLEQGANVNAVDSKGNTALHMAAKGREKNREKIVQILLEYRADTGVRRDDGRTPLIIAVQKGVSEVIRALLEANAAIGVRDALQWTALHYAAMAGAEATAAMLLKYGANVDISGQYGRTPLHCAALAGKTKVVRILIQYKASVKIKDRNGQTAFDLTTRKSTRKGQVPVSLVQKQSQDYIADLVRPKGMWSVLSGSTY
jgi:ankyrin repeat protein